MLNDDEKRKAGNLISSLVDRQNQMKSDDPFALMKELTQTFEQGNSTNFDLNSGGFKSLINKTSNPTELYQRNFSSEVPGKNFPRKEAPSFPSTF